MSTLSIRNMGMGAALLTDSALFVQAAMRGRVARDRTIRVPESHTGNGGRRAAPFARRYKAPFAGLPGGGAVNSYARRYNAY